MSSAGQQLVAGRVPGENIALTEETSDSSTFTTSEEAIISVTASVVAGRTYWVWCDVNVSSSVDNDDIRIRIREDDDSGTVLQQRSLEVVVDDQETTGMNITTRVRWTAAATEMKTFVATGERLSGSGDCKLDAISSKPSYLGVDYLSG